MGHHTPKPDVVVAVVRIVPVAVGAAHVPMIIVEGAAAQHLVVCERIPHKQQELFGFSLRMCDLDPAAQQLPDLGHHAGRVLVLAGGQPFPAGCQA